MAALGLQKTLTKAKKDEMINTVKNSYRKLFRENKQRP